ncbi:MAG: LytR family transcriptional regulator [Calditrichales bacterium]|nr:MAG: LytR family transcriptional regulator [Calditrichales bacterium]
MQRRKRRSTQTSRKKTEQTPSLTGYYMQPTKSKSGRKRLLVFLSVIVLAAIAYYSYNMDFSLFGSGPATSDKSSATVTDAPEEIPAEPKELAAPFEHKIQIEILNGCGVNGVAKLFQTYLRDEGFDVVNTENYTLKGAVIWNVKESFLIDHIGVTEKAKTVAKSLNIPLSRIEHKESTTPIYDVSVVIGKDYKNLLPQ